MNNEYKCIEDDKSTVLWIMLIMLILFGLLVFLMMRMRLFFNKKDKEKEEAPDIALQTSIELVGPPQAQTDQIKRTAQKKKSTLTIITDAERKNGKQVSFEGKKLNGPIKNNKLFKNEIIETIGQSISPYQIPKSALKSNKNIEQPNP